MLKNIVVIVAVMFSLFVSASSVSAGTDGCYVGCPGTTVIKRTTVVKKYYMNGTDTQARQRLDTVEGRVSTLETQMSQKANTADVNAAFTETNGRIDRVENRVHAIENWWNFSPIGTFFLFLAAILLIAAIIGGYFFPRHGAVAAAAPAAPQYPPYPAYPPFPAYPQQQPPVVNQPPPATPTAPPSINVPLNVTVTPIDIELTPRIRGAQ